MVLAAVKYTPEVNPVVGAPAARSVQLEDEVLVQRAVDGDETAYAVLVRRYRNRIFNFTFRYTGNAAEAEDLTQDVFIKAYRNLHRFRGDAKFSTWLYQIAKNMSINRLRSIKRAIVGLVNPIVDDEGDEGLDPIAQAASQDRSPEDRMLGQEAEKVVQHAIQKLTPVYRAALILRDIEDLPYEEIAVILGLAEGTVKSRIHRARSELKQILAGYHTAGEL